MFLDIWRACRDGDLDLVRIIIREGQDINEQTQYLKNTPLHIAAFNGHFLIVKYLVEAGANPIITNRDGLTPLHFAEKAREDLDRSFARPGSSSTASLTKAKRAGSAKGPRNLTADLARALGENLKGIKQLLSKSE